MSQTLQNIYYKRPVATAKPCYICYRPTNTVLWNPQDFLYSCDAHLTDPGFATLVKEERKPLTEDEIKKVKEEWEEKQRQKAEKEKAKPKDGDKEGDQDKSKTDPKPDAAKKPAVSLPTPTAPTHQKFILDRQIFAMRVTENKSRRQTSQAAQVAPLLPVVPKRL